MRHGETKEGKKNIILGQLDGTLSAKGKLKIKKYIKHIKETKIIPALIISSDLKRAKKTAEIISKNLNIPIKYEKLIRERHAGIAQGKKENEIDWEIYERKSLLKRKHQGGESFLDAKARAKKFLLKLKTAEKNIIVVSHSAFIFMLLSEFYKIPFEKLLKYKEGFFIINTKKGGLKYKPRFIKLSNNS